jgi:hypothetical protein
MLTKYNFYRNLQALHHMTISDILFSTINSIKYVSYLTCMEIIILTCQTFYTYFQNDICGCFVGQSIKWVTCISLQATVTKSLYTHKTPRNGTCCVTTPEETERHNYHYIADILFSVCFILAFRTSTAWWNIPYNVFALDVNWYM